MHPEPWPSAQHLPVIALAIVLCAALVAATLITARLRLGQVREADTRNAQLGALGGQINALDVRIALLETSGSLTANQIRYLAAQLTAASASVDSAIIVHGSGSIPGNVKVSGDAIVARDCACSRRGCTACQASRRGTASA